MNNIKQTSRPWRVVCFASLFLLGIWVGATMGTPRTAEAEVRKGTQREAFKSGAARSELILRDISTTLQRMDGRIATMEKLIVQAAKQGS